MPKLPTVSNEELLERLASVFRNYGYDGASMKIISDKTGLKRSSLYHRFPDGKLQMAQEVLNYLNNKIYTRVIEPLTADDQKTLEAKVDNLIKQFHFIYIGGNESCLYNMLSHPVSEEGPFAIPIKEAFEILLESLSKTLVNYGCSEECANDRAMSAIILLQGALVLSRGLRNTDPFEKTLHQIKSLLLSEQTV